VGLSAIAQVEPITSARALRGPFDYLLPEPLREDVTVGSMLVVPFGARTILGVVTGLSERSEIADRRLLAPLRALELGVPEELVELARWVAGEYCSTLARALGLVLPPGATRRLGGRRRAVPRARHGQALGARLAPGARLSPEQQAALDPLCAALAEGRFEQRLLHGVTASGKTEVYLRAAAEALQRGRGAIVMVPEIALTPQIVSRFSERFGETVAVLHSRLTTAQRYAEWRRLREGEARICVGPRSAVFAPVGRLGLIVIDEEHEASYKHEGDPRYDAREVAQERARRAGAVLLLGSATPRPESALRLPASRLAQRVDGRPLPAVEVLDMRGQTSTLHPASVQALAEVRAGAGKAIVLLNRRGWSNFMSCRACGASWGCPECDVTLVLHRAERLLACHHCGHREPVPERCPHCSSSAVARHGAGTERLAHDLAAVFDEGDFPVFRLDADAVLEGGGEGAPDAGAAAILGRFQEASRGALIGTQMVAKGHDFPDVRLALVIDADATLRFPDFRAEERTFALIAQLAGRAGRGGHGRVLVQTVTPEARAIAHAAAHDSDGFLAGELERRRALGYPPFSHLVRIVCSSVEAPAALAAAQALRAELELRLQEAEGGGEGPVTVLGPATLFRLRGRERRMLVLKAGSRPAAVRAAGESVQALASGRAHAGVSFSVDVDPQ
jgi:primosomal protein N' (replication factor Y)